MTSAIEDLRYYHKWRLENTIEKPTHWVGKNGEKFAYFNSSMRNKTGELRYSLIEIPMAFNGEKVGALPKEGYPYTLEHNA